MLTKWMTWIVLFFSYSILGWVWESCFVSCRKRQWINRGFLRGPWLPIYGSGAVIILMITAPARDHIVLIYLLGMIGATVLEYVTGAAMEKLFHVRYWDYSQKPLNVNGHICLGVSLGWGVFSVFLVKGIHPAMLRFLSLIPTPVLVGVNLLFCVFFVMDSVQSIQAALDLKQMLVRLSAEREKWLAAMPRPENLRQKWQELQEMRDTTLRPRIVSLLHRNPTATSQKYREALRDLKERLESLRRR